MLEGRDINCAEADKSDSALWRHSSTSIKRGWDPQMAGGLYSQTHNSDVHDEPAVKNKPGDPTLKSQKCPFGRQVSFQNKWRWVLAETLADFLGVLLHPKSWPSSMHLIALLRYNSKNTKILTMHSCFNEFVMVVDMARVT